MRRRAFIAALGSAAAWPLVARAQQRERMRRIGALQPGREGDPESQNRRAAFVDSLQKFGWTEGTNVLIDYRWVGDDADRIRLYATELTGMRPDVIWASRSLPLLLLKRDAMWRSIEATAPSFGVRLTPADAPGPDEIERAIE